MLVAPDRATADYVCRILEKSQVEIGTTIAKTRGCISEASKTIGEKRVVLVLASAPNLGKGQLELVRQVVASGGLVFAWVSHPVDGTSESRDQWYLAKLLEQRGAITLSRLACLSEAVRIVSFFGGLVPRSPVFIKRSSSSLGARVVSSFRKAGIQVSKTPSKKTNLSVSVSSEGEIVFKVGNRRSLVIENLSSFTQALTLLFLAAGSVDAIDEPIVEPERSDIDLIVRPPARLLSETASKRIVKAFGVDAPPEQLCQSPSEAVRFAGTLGSPVTLKLVKPGLQDKKELGAVISDVSGAAAVRRAVQSLLSLASVMGPPKPLGILVSEQLREGVGIWITMADRPAFGRMILIGGEHAPRSDPSVALQVPVTATQAQAALVRAGVVPLSKASAKLARAIARLSVFVSELGSGVERIEIDPLIAADESEEALACDVLVGIAGSG
jgi:hypothetical protein